MNSLILKVLKDLASNKIRYCHWKSNNRLESALAGEDDLDFLIDLSGKYKLFEILSRHHFVVAKERGRGDPFIYHFYANDPKTGLLIHFHIYFRLITGGSIVKNFWIPLEQAVLSNTHFQEDICVVDKEVDFVLFVIRKFLEMPSIIEHYLLYKDKKNMIDELNWLEKDIDRKKVEAFIRREVSSLSYNFFLTCVGVLKQDVNVFKKVIFGYKMRRLFSLTVLPGIIASWKRFCCFGRAYVAGKFSIFGKSRHLFPGGVLIAFVGAEACGKSTLSSEVNKWLSKSFDVSYVHMGKPPATFMTLPFWMAIRTYSKIKRVFKAAKKSVKKDMSTPSFDRTNPIVAVLCAIQRYVLVRKCIRKMMRGATVITDRYPGQCVGNIDSPQIKAPVKIITKLLSSLERYIYKKIPDPDFLFIIDAPLEITLERNKRRAKPEPEDFIRSRYKLARNFSYNCKQEFRIHTAEHSLDEALLMVKKLIWCGHINS